MLPVAVGAHRGMHVAPLGPLAVDARPVQVLDLPVAVPAGAGDVEVVGGALRPARGQDAVGVPSRPVAVGADRDGGVPLRKQLAVHRGLEQVHHPLQLQVVVPGQVQVVVAGPAGARLVPAGHHGLGVRGGEDLVGPVAVPASGEVLGLAQVHEPVGHELVPLLLVAAGARHRGQIVRMGKLEHVPVAIGALHARVDGVLEHVVGDGGDVGFGTVVAQHAVRIGERCDLQLCVRRGDESQRQEEDRDEDGRTHGPLPLSLPSMSPRSGVPYSSEISAGRGR